MKFKLERIGSALFTALEHSDALSMIGGQQGTIGATVFHTMVGPNTDTHTDPQYDGPA